MRINEYVPDSSIFDFNKVQQNNNIDNSDKSQNENSISDFASVLKGKLDEVNTQQVQADNSTKEFIEGDRSDIHNVMLDTEKAKMSLELAVQIRNKFVEAYQELSRTQF